VTVQTIHVYVLNQQRRAATQQPKKVTHLGCARSLRVVPRRHPRPLARPLDVVEAERLGVVVRAALLEARDERDREAEGVARLVVAVAAEDLGRAVHGGAVAEFGVSLQAVKGMCTAHSTHPTTVMVSWRRSFASPKSPSLHRKPSPTRICGGAYV
jgi:hypothetical protein